MSQKRVYVALSRFCVEDDRPRRVLAEAGFEVVENRSGRRLTRDEIITALSGTDGVLAGVETYDASTLAMLPRLRCISRCGVGTDAIDLEAARHYQISVLTTPDEVVEPVAQMTVAMIFALARNFPLYVHGLREGSWRQHTGYVLSEWTIGLVGFGRIGRAVEGYLRVFRPRILVADPNVHVDDLPETVEMRNLHELLAEADVVSLHASRRPEEGRLLGPREFGAMKRGSRLVNTARGYLVEEDALYHALRSNHLAGAALDVFAAEPCSGPLTSMPQVLCTPHVSTLTRAARAAMELRCATNLITFFANASALKLSAKVREDA